MGIHNHPSAVGCVDKYIGTSYDVVKRVADNLDYLLQIANVAGASAVLDEIQILLTQAQIALAAVDGRIAGKQDTLSASNIKTINGESILGSGNIIVQPAGGATSANVTAAQDHVHQLLLMGI